MEPSPDHSRTVLEVDGRYFILATGSLADENDRVLKQGESFAVFDRYGDIRPVGLGEEGVFHEGTRFLSSLSLVLSGERPLLLGSTAKRDNSRLAIDLTNPDLTVGGRTLRNGILHISRTKVLWAAACHERIEIRNFGERTVRLPLSIRLAADYADIFEVRGMEREERGSLLQPRVSSGTLVLGYEGLDGVRRRTRIAFDPTPDLLRPGIARYDLRLPPGRSMAIELRIGCEIGRRRTATIHYGAALERASHQIRERLRASARVSSSSELFDDWFDRSLADVAMMTSDTGHGPYPYAGVPWFSTVFGRDGLITALQLMWVQPSLARGVLGTLAATQATTVEPERDAQPGKILHELRGGEMASLGEVPFARYYGSHDATPLFVMLAAAYYRQTADLALIEGLWPHLEAALEWLDGPADPDGDGFVEYQRQTSTGLANQGWKDAWDSVFHADGELAEGPIALCELQAYAFGARRGAAVLAAALGHTERAERLREQAEALRQRFEEAFWDDELGTYGIALDGKKRLCRVRTSNPGHCLLTGIVAPERAARLADELLSEAMFSGWGIRTVGAGQARYNPMSYQDGSIWPHDNALIAMGLGRYGFHDHAARILSAIFDASRHFDLARLPELFCGFTRRPGEGPTRYPVACSPQAWASGAIFMLLQACLGLDIDAPNRSVHLDHARLPTFLDHLRIVDLPVGEARLDLNLQRHAQGVGVDVVRRDGDVEVVAVK